MELDPAPGTKASGLFKWVTLPDPADRLRCRLGVPPRDGHEYWYCPKCGIVVQVPLPKSPDKGFCPTFSGPIGRGLFCADCINAKRAKGNRGWVHLDQLKPGAQLPDILRKEPTLNGPESATPDIV